MSVGDFWGAQCGGFGVPGLESRGFEIPDTRIWGAKFGVWGVWGALCGSFGVSGVLGCPVRGIWVPAAGFGVLGMLGVWYGV